MTDDIEQLLAFGRMGLETGYYDQASGYFKQVLELDPSNQEATKGLARANEMLLRGGGVRWTQRIKPARQDQPVEPTPTVGPPRSVLGISMQERQRSPVQGAQKQSGLDNIEEDSMESKTDDSLQWLGSQLKNVSIKTWIIVFTKMGVAYMFLMTILAVVALVVSLILAKVDISIMEVLGDFL